MIEIEHIQAKSAAVNLFAEAPVDLVDVRHYSVDVTFAAAATLNGVLKLEAGNDTTTLRVLDGSEQRVRGGVGHLWSVGGANYRYFRVRWEYLSGAGTITANVLLKEPVVRNS